MATPSDGTGICDEQGLVRFRLRHVQVPPANELLATLWGDEVLEGLVVEHSRADGDERCVVVKVPELDQLIVVLTADLITPPRRHS